MFDRFHNSSAAALIAASIASATFAQERPVVVQGEPFAKSERVSFASLDLGDAKGRKALHFRIAGAVERVCDKEIGRDGLQANEYYACEAGAWNRARPQIARAVSLAMNGESAALAMTSILVTAG